MHYDLSCVLHIYQHNLTASELSALMDVLNQIIEGKIHIKEHVMNNDGGDEVKIYIQQEAGN